MWYLFLFPLFAVIFSLIALFEAQNDRLETATKALVGALISMVCLVIFYHLM